MSIQFTNTDARLSMRCSECHQLLGSDIISRLSTMHGCMVTRLGGQWEWVRWSRKIGQDVKVYSGP